MDRQVVVTGLGVLSPIGNNTKNSWKNAISGNSGVRSIKSFDTTDLSVKIAADVKNFEPKLFMEEKEAKRTSRFVQFALAAANEALEDAGLNEELCLKTDIGCSIGAGLGSLSRIYNNSIKLFEKGPRKVSPFFIPYSIANMAAGIVAIKNKLTGPNICTTTACSSGTHAIGEAYLYIKNGISDAMLCGGSESVISRLGISGFTSMRALSTNNDNPSEASRPFDKDRDGFVMGEGSGLLVLEEFEQAKARGANIYAHVTGYGMSCDAYHITAPAPEGEGAARCMASALKAQNIGLTEVDYINAHGTSTTHNDINESIAIENVFGHHVNNLAVSSTKGVTGHCLGAAGGIEAVFLAKAISEGVIPMTTNLKESDSECRLDYVPMKSRKKDIRVGMSNSFGFGGTNASIVFAHKDYVNK